MEIICVSVYNMRISFPLTSYFNTFHNPFVFSTVTFVANRKTCQSTSEEYNEND